VVFAALIVVALAACGGAAPADDHTARGVAVVVEVVDGDTITVRLGGREERVRLLGIDTPETVAPDSPVECFGPEASARTHELLAPGTEVRLERDIEARDRFDRLLAHVVRLEDELFVNEVLAAEGFAEALVIEPNVAHRDRIAAAVTAARAEGRGRWGAC
jgi:micrococcal nuclease